MGEGRFLMVPRREKLGETGTQHDSAQEAASRRQIPHNGPWCTLVVDDLGQLHDSALSQVGPRSEVAVARQISTCRACCVLALVLQCIELVHGTWMCAGLGLERGRCPGV